MKAKFLLLAAVIGVAYSWHKGWLGEWVETAAVEARQDVREARPKNPRSDRIENFR
jgi:hypothetical protein